MKKFAVGLLGCTGVVGQRFVQALSAHPFFDLRVLAASPESAGQRYKKVGKWKLEGEIPEKFRDQVVENLGIKALRTEGVEIVFSALPSEVAKRVENEFAKHGFKVFSNASAFRMHPQIPILVPEVNPEHLELINQKKKEAKGFIVTNPNCAVAGLVLGLKPLTGFGIKSVFVTTYQALSGAGYPGVASLDILGNVIPYIKGEEEKVEEETKKILGTLGAGEISPAKLDIAASCARVPVRDGHLESVVVELEKDVNIEAIKKAMQDFKGVPQAKNLPTAPEKPILVLKEENRPQPLLDAYAGEPKRARGMAISIGGIKKAGRKIRFFLLVHNTIRGAAGCSVLNAELAYEQKRL